MSSKLAEMLSQAAELPNMDSLRRLVRDGSTIIEAIGQNFIPATQESIEKAIQARVLARKDVVRNKEDEVRQIVLASNTFCTDIMPSTAVKEAVAEVLSKPLIIHQMQPSTSGYKGNSARKPFFPISMHQTASAV